MRTATAVLTLTAMLLVSEPARAQDAGPRAHGAMQVLMGTVFGAVTYVAMSRSDHPGGSESRHDGFVMRSAGAGTLVGAQVVYLFGDRRSRATWAWTTASGLLPMGITFLGVRADGDCRRRDDDDCGSSATWQAP